MLYISNFVILRNCLLSLILTIFIACSAHTIKTEEENTLQQIVRAQIHPYVIKYIEYADSRWIHREDTKVVSDLLRACFEHRFSIRQVNKDDLRNKALNLYYKYRKEAVEDGADIQMTALNRSAVFASISLVSDEVRQYIFINDANEILGDLQPDNPLHHMFYLVLEWIYSIEEKDKNKDTITGNYNVLYDIASKQSYPKAFHEIVSALYRYCENEGLFNSDTEQLSEKNITDIYDTPN